MASGGVMVTRRRLLIAGIGLFLVLWVIGMAWLINFQQTRH